ncbi:transglycosylase domain-containing protein [Rickettsiales endosymbiont of Peranema trichophorum]|uniref:transglycosylase domain-containing protein n=1 Tax=Rickettsiales endosymbiont of Peranema trichophorum TaxID=2486577 RepID=UPI0013EEC415|nr:PBP1A family penicillin-binding protein [Rickettsiales endosymbiont of Peranema trichophorum]
MLKKKTSKTPRKTKGFKILRNKIFVLLLKCFVVLLFGLGCMCLLLVLYYSRDLPDISDIHDLQRQPTITILDSRGRVLANYGDMYGRRLEYQQIPQDLIEAVIAAEDRRFFEHCGIDIFGILRALYRNQVAGKIVQGGSTITQQLAKIIFLNSERTLKRKIQEMLLALRLERTYTKQEILSIYLNRVYLGSGNFGIDAASMYYFGKLVEHLTLYESAMLAGMLKAPSSLSPLTNPLRSVRRAKLVLQGMEDMGFVSSTDIRNERPPRVMQRGRMRGALQNPYFADYVVERLTDLIGMSNRDLKVYTTCDIQLQEDLEKAISLQAKSNFKKYDVGQAAGVVLGRDGAIKAMVGGISYANSQFNRAVYAKRQPSSVFKIFVYLAALENGATVGSMVEDSPITVNHWSPRNFVNRYAGLMRLDKAFADSVNTVAVKVSEKLGRYKVIDMARRFGITEKLSNVPSLALGTDVTSLLKLTAAMLHIANSGMRFKPHAITAIFEKSTNNILYKYDAGEPTRLVDNHSAIELKSMLYKAIKEGTGRAASSPGIKEYGKTGTSQDFRDALFVGFDERLVTGIWVGNDNNQPMKRVSGGTLPAKIWKDFMSMSRARYDRGEIAGKNDDTSGKR